MNSLAIYQDLLERGFQFQVSGDRLDVKGTTEPLTTEVIGLLTERQTGDHSLGCRVAKRRALSTTRWESDYSIQL